MAMRVVMLLMAVLENSARWHFRHGCIGAALALHLASAVFIVCAPLLYEIHQVVSTLRMQVQCCFRSIGGGWMNDRQNYREKWHSSHLPISRRPRAK